MNDRRKFIASMFSSLLSLLILASACSGTKVAGGIHVAVDPARCHETDAGASLDLVDLDCLSLGGEATVEVTFPRTEWSRLRARTWDAGIVESLGK